ncbi:hypothetical protein TAM4_2329 [Thermococcus sp. AM4]|nr:hypothetical protein TAM4_2329 [Thermococcus sp. AM4]
MLAWRKLVIGYGGLADGVTVNVNFCTRGGGVNTQITICWL